MKGINEYFLIYFHIRKMKKVTSPEEDKEKMAPPGIEANHTDDKLTTTDVILTEPKSVRQTKTDETPEVQMTFKEKMSGNVHNLIKLIGKEKT